MVVSRSQWYPIQFNSSHSHFPPAPSPPPSRLPVVSLPFLLSPRFFLLHYPLPFFLIPTFSCSHISLVLLPFLHFLIPTSHFSFSHYSIPIALFPIISNKVNDSYRIANLLVSISHSNTKYLTDNTLHSAWRIEKGKEIEQQQLILYFIALCALWRHRFSTSWKGNTFFFVLLSLSHHRAELLL